MLLLFPIGKFTKKLFIHVHKHYKVLTDVFKERDWAGADSFCREGDMTLLKIESAQENNLIYYHYLVRPGK